MSKIRGKRGQEEMVGFGVIVILVVIIGLIFFSIAIRNSGGSEKSRESEQLDNFIKSMAYYTSSCQITNSEYINLGALVRECRSGNICINGMTSCEALSREIKEIMDASYFVSDNNESFTRYYSVRVISGSLNSTQGQDIIEPISSGSEEDCNKNKISNYRPFSTGVTSESIYLKIDICNSQLS